MEKTNQINLIENFFRENTKYTTFLKENKINLETYITNLKNYETSGLRCIRINPLKFSSNKTKENLKKLNFKEHSFFKDLMLISKNFKINGLEEYKKGLIYGIEASSAIVVKCMDPSPGETILDVCCSPGAKLLYIADEILKKSGFNFNGKNEKKFENFKRKFEGDVIGNDINKKRLNISKNLCEKYGLDKVIKLVNLDATKLKKEDIFEKKDKEIDKILCDVECSHDGSLKHILKFINEGAKGREEVKEESNFGEKKKKILEDDTISNKERKRRLKQLEENQVDIPYFSEFNSSNFIYFLTFFRNGMEC